MTLTRRSFIKTSAALAAGLAVPTYLKAGTLSSSDRVSMALWVKQPANLPLTIQASGGNYLFPDWMHETFDTQSVLYRFDDYLLLWEHNAGIESGPYGKNHGLVFTGGNCHP